MDKLLQEAKRLAQQSIRESYLPIQGRIAYVVNHGPSNTTNDDTALTQSIAHALNTHGFDTLCFVQPVPPRHLDIGIPNISPEVNINGVRYIHTRWDSLPKNDQEHLETTVKKLEQIFLVYRPEIILGDSSVMNGLPALTLAKRFSLPFYLDIRDFGGRLENSNTENFHTNSERNVFIVKQANHSFAVSSEVKNWLTQSGVDEKKIDLLFPDFNNSLLTNSLVNILKGNMAESTESHIQGSQVSATKTDQPSNSVSTLIEPSTFTLSNDGKFHVGEIFAPTSGATLEISASVVYQLRKKGLTNKAVMLLDFLDASDKRIEAIPNVGISAAFKQHFKYLNTNNEAVSDPVEEVFNLQLPNEVVRIRVDVGSLGLADDEFIDIRIQARCYDERIEKEQKRQLSKQQLLPKAVVHDAEAKRYTSDLTIACILDEFTAECLSHEVNLVKVTQEGWRVQLENCNPDFLLVESCWRGNDGNWGTLTKGSGGSKKLSELLNYCKKSHIPTVFWNKEDPPHYEKFGPIAALFDLAITTDVNMVHHYKKDFGVNAYPLSFGAQPKVHNPKPLISRLEKAVFAGSYYGDKPKRCADFNEIMTQVELAGVGYDIFDRNYRQNIEKFAFPERYQSNIVGNLSPVDVWKAHKGYKYQINMNSVQGSATMFARRVYESLASGTPVISNDSVGVRKLFGEIVIMPGDESIAKQLKRLESSPEAYQDLARRGVRAVMREHTYGHRIQELCRLLGMDIEVKPFQATLAVTVNSEADIQRAKKLFDSQTAQCKRLFIELENFDTAYKFLNESSASVTYAMKLGHKLYSSEYQFYGSSCVLKHSANDSLSAEALEDFIYWGAIEEGPNNNPQMQYREELNS